MATQDSPNLYERLGGVYSIATVVDDLIDSFNKVNDPGIDIYWGAYLGTNDEILVSGNLKGRTHDIERIRSEAKSRKGWIMDTYLLRRTTAAT